MYPLVTDTGTGNPLYFTRKNKGESSTNEEFSIARLGSHFLN